MKDLKTLRAMIKNHPKMTLNEEMDKIAEDPHLGLAFEWGKCRVVVAIGGGWDHVSVSMSTGKLPGYKEMKAIKRWCFKPEEWVVEYHPPSADYISVNDGVLHLWRPQDEVMPTPPAMMV